MFVDEQDVGSAIAEFVPGGSTYEFYDGVRVPGWPTLSQVFLTMRPETAAVVMAASSPVRIEGEMTRHYVRPVRQEGTVVVAEVQPWKPRRRG